MIVLQLITATAEKEQLVVSWLLLLFSILHFLDQNRTFREILRGIKINFHFLLAMQKMVVVVATSFS